LAYDGNTKKVEGSQSNSSSPENGSSSMEITFYKSDEKIV
jgi:hypothetical protein